MYDKNNIFAKIIRGEIDTPKIYEDSHMIAINDKFPIASIHVLVIPKGDYIDYEDFISNAGTEDLIWFFTKIPHIATLAGANDYKLVCNKGKDVGQTVFHFHMHIISGGIFKEV